MKGLAIVLVGGVLGATTINACGSDSPARRAQPISDASMPSLCSPGDTRRCFGRGACAGGQECKLDGTWSSCDCGASSGTGGVNTGTGGRAAGGVPLGFGGAFPGGGGFVAAGGRGGTGGTAGAGGYLDGGPAGPITSIDRCSPAELAQFAADSLSGGGEVLYPYNGTVFPRGLPPPTVMWSQPGPADAVLLQLYSQTFFYRECFGATTPTRLMLPSDAWEAAAANSAGPTKPVTVSVMVRSGADILDHASATLYFATSTLDAAVYYMTYNSPLAQNNGAVLRVNVGQAQPTAFLTVNGAPPLGPCVGCHSASANASVMMADTHSYPQGPFISASYDITGPPPTLVFNNLPEAGFAGIYPDGSLAMTNGPPNVASRSYAFPDVGGAPVALISSPTNSTSRLLDMKTGQVVQATGWNVQRATMPMFSPDGKHLVYNDFDQGAGHSLWLIDFDAASKVFSNRRLLYNDAQRYPGWPSFTPDSKRVVFTLGSRDDFASQVPDFNLPIVSPNQPAGNGRLMMVDIAAGQVISLDFVNGYGSAGSYLPNNDNDRDFYPTVAPMAAGGFHWVFFTSRRTYGNLQELDVNDAKSKKIWVSAIDPNAPAGTDASRPAFLLPGQEIDTGNFRPVVTSAR